MSNLNIDQQRLMHHILNKTASNATSLEKGSTQTQANPQGSAATAVLKSLLNIGMSAPHHVASISQSELPKSSASVDQSGTQQLKSIFNLTPPKSNLSSSPCQSSSSSQQPATKPGSKTKINTKGKKKKSKDRDNSNDGEKKTYFASSAAFAAPTPDVLPIPDFGDSTEWSDDDEVQKKDVAQNIRNAAEVSSGLNTLQLNTNTSSIIDVGTNTNTVPQDKPPKISRERTANLIALLSGVKET
jgi:hypothetical protein